MPTLLIVLLVLALHIFLCFRKNWAWGGIIPALVLVIMIASPFIFEDTTFIECVKVFIVPEMLLLLAWILGRESIKKRDSSK